MKRKIQMNLMQNNLPKVLLYSGTVPGEQGVGGIILQDICESMGPENIQCFAALSKRHDKNQLMNNPYFLDGCQKKHEAAYRPIKGKLGTLVSHATYQFAFPKHAKRIAQGANEAGKKLKPDVVFAVLNSPSIIATAREVADALKVPLHVLVWDAPELLARQLNYHSMTSKLILKSFGKCITSADRVAVVGESMQDEYKKKYNVDSIIVRHGLPEESEEKTTTSNRDNENIIIGYAGSITAHDAFASFMKMLDSCDWTINNKKVILRLVGVRYHLKPKGPQHIEFFGWQPVEKTVELLSECDLLYLPQPFDKPNYELAKLSFPTKLTTYLAAKKPVFLHAPKYGSIVPFLKKHPFGIWCEELDLKNFIPDIENFLSDSEFVTTAIQSGKEAVAQELNARVFIERFREFITV